MTLEHALNPNTLVMPRDHATLAHWSAGRVSTLLTIIALGLWSYSLVQAKLSIGSLGLIHSFPITFLVSLGLLTIASAVLWVSKENHTKLLFLQLSLLVVSFWLVPVLAGGSLPFLNHMYRDYGNVDYILRNGHIDPEIVTYLNWPGSQLLFASGMKVTGWEGIPHGFLATSTFFMMILILLMMYAFLKSIFPASQTNYTWAALWVACLGCVTGPVRFSPPAMGFLLMLCVLMLITAMERGRMRDIGLRSCMIVVGATLTFVHLLTALYSLAIVFGQFIHKRKSPITFILLLISLIVAWQVYVATSYFSFKLPIFLESALSLDALAFHSMERGTNGSESHIVISSIRFYFTLLLAGLAITGGLLAYLKHKWNPNDRSMLIVLAAIIATSIGVGAAYGGFHIFNRVLTFILPIIAYFAVKWLDFRRLRVIFVGCLLIALPLHMITHYGNQTYDHLSTGFIKSLDFFENSESGGTVYSNILLELPEQQDKYSMMIALALYRAEKSDQITPEQIMENNSENLVYVHVDNRDEERFEFEFDDAAFFREWHASLADSHHFNYIYSNKDVNLYFGDPKGN